MRCFLCLTVLSVVVTFAHGQTPAPVTVHRDIVYASPGNLPQKLDLDVPSGLSAPPPLLIFIHGGGWQGGSKDHPMFANVTRLGFAFASIDYRLSGVAIWPAQIEDCKAAVRWLRAHASEYGYDGNRIGVAGASAGGHLVAMLGTTANDPKLEGDEGNAGVSSAVQAVVDYFGPTDFVSLVDQVTPQQRANINNPVVHLFGGPLWDNGWIGGGLDKAKDASPVYHVTPQACPFFIVQGDHDPIVPPQQSVELNDALKKAGVNSTLTVVAGGGHGFRDPASTLGAIAFLQQQLGVK